VQKKKPRRKEGVRYLRRVFSLAESRLATFERSSLAPGQAGGGCIHGSEEDARPKSAHVSEKKGSRELNRGKSRQVQNPFGKRQTSTSEVSKKGDRRPAEGGRSPLLFGLHNRGVSSKKGSL